MANKQVYNINALRPIIVAAHNGGNKRAITSDMVQGGGIDTSYFMAWKDDVNALRKTVADYIAKKRAVKYGYTIGGKDVTADDVAAAREEIFPKWKTILEVGEKSKFAKELHVNPDDVEDLIGFAWDFVDSGKGTIEAISTEQIFRKKVEALLGCAIARNAVLLDGDRETLEKYRSAQSRIQNAKDKADELAAEKKSYKLLLGDVPETETKFIEFLENHIKAVEDAETANETSKTKAEEDLAKVKAKATLVLNRIKLAK